MGRTFAFAFPQASGNDLEIEIYAASDVNSDANLKISAPSYVGGSGINQDVVLPKNQKLKITLPNYLRLSTGTVEKKGLRVESDQDIVVFGMNRVSGKCGGFMAIPEDALGSEYYGTSFRPESTPALGTKVGELAVVSIEPATTITFEFPVGVSVQFAGQT